MSFAATLLQLLGAALLLRCAYQVYSFVRPYITPSQLHRFHHGADTYALVTGASDGIGRAISRELYRRGFNIILHGRNEEKLWKAAELIRQERWALRDIKVWVADATSPDIDFARVVEERFGKLDIGLVVHNVSPYAPRPSTIDGVPEPELVNDLRCGVHFPFLLTRALLPKLRAAPGPVELVFIGSFGGSHAMPRLVPVSPTKAFLRQFNGNLTADEHFPGPLPAQGQRHSNVSSTYMLVGSVVTANRKVEESLLSPSAETFAKAVVDRIGCGRGVVAPYLPQAVVFALVDMLSEGIQEVMFRKSIQNELQVHAKRQ